MKRRMFAYMLALAFLLAACSEKVVPIAPTEPPTAFGGSFYCNETPAPAECRGRGLFAVFRP